MQFELKLPGSRVSVPKHLLAASQSGDLREVTGKKPAGQKESQ